MAREKEKNGLAFIVIEPGGIIPDYAVEISDADVEILGISEVMIDDPKHCYSSIGAVF